MIIFINSCRHYGQKTTNALCSWLENRLISSRVGATLFPLLVGRSPIEIIFLNMQSFDYYGVVLLSYHPVSSYSILSVQNLSKNMVAIFMP